MAQIKILTEKDLRSLLRLDLDVVTCVENGFRALSKGGVVMPPILRLDIEDNNGEVDVKTAYVPGLSSFAIKVSPGFFDNPRLGLPSLNGLMVLFSAKTGLVEAMLLDNGYLTALRTAAAGAVAAKYLSREHSRTAAILGSGEQARLQLEALLLVRPIEAARIWGRSHKHAARAAEDMSEQLGINVVAEADAAAAVRGADIVVTCTPATKPILMYDWLTPGQHITAMGSDAEHKNELQPEIVTRADLYIPDSLSQVSRLGELHHAIEAGLCPNESIFPELGGIISGLANGRTSESNLSVVDLTGTGVQDTAIACLAKQRADSAQSGMSIET